MKRRRGDRVGAAPVDEQWEVRFASNEAAKGWADLVRQARGNVIKAYEAMRDNPTPNPPTARQHRLRYVLATRTHDGQE